MILNQFLPEYRTYINGRLKPRTVHEYQRLIDTLICQKFGGVFLTKISTKDVEQWHMGLKKETPVQANRALAVLSGILKLAARWGHIPASPVQGIEYAKETARESYLSSEEQTRLIGAIYAQSSTECAFLLTLYFTGARPGELELVTWGQFTGDTLELSDSKTGRRTIYLSPEAVKAIRSLTEKAQDELIFKGVNPTTLWRRVRKEAGLAGFRLYDLRHTFASAALGSGVTLEAISQLLGHKNPQTTRRYAHLTKDYGLETAAKAAANLKRG